MLKGVEQGVVDGINVDAAPPQVKKKWTSKNKYLFRTIQLPGEIKEKPKLPISIKTKKSDNEKVENLSKLPKPKPTFPCETCDKIFKNSSALVKHGLIHSKEKPFQCNICDKRFGTKFALQRHGSVHNDAEAKFTCEVEGCSRRFSTKEWLAIHTRTHNDIRPFECHFEGCGKTFVCQSTLNRHSLAHKKEPSYLCNECGKFFVNNFNLKMHLQSHSTQRDYNCDRCRMKFKRALDLKRHRLTHKQLPMIPCPIAECEHEFRRKDNLLRHLRLMHYQTREEAHETYKLLQSQNPQLNKQSLPELIDISDDAIIEPRKRTPRRPKPKQTEGTQKKKRSIATKKSTEIEPAPPKSIISQTVPVQTNSETSVTTSVIRMAKSSSYYRKRNKMEEETLRVPHISSSPSYRPPSPGQEYIHYLNSLNTPGPFKVRLKSTPEEPVQQLLPPSYYYQTTTEEDFSSQQLQNQVQYSPNPLTEYTTELNYAELENSNTIYQEDEFGYYEQPQFPYYQSQSYENVERPDTVIKRAFPSSTSTSTFNLNYQEEVDFEGELKPSYQEVQDAAQVSSFEPEKELPISSKSGIVNRDPRKNFLWENSFRNARDEDNS